jgi:hypothetical protein
LQVARQCADWVGARRGVGVWKAALSILDEAIMLGKHKTIKSELAIRRFEAAERPQVDA